MTSDVTLTGAANQAQRTLGQGAKLAEDFDDFLTLLTTQLQNQDPLAPMDSTEFTNQLVQFSQVEQQINLNQKIDNLVQLQLANVSSIGLGYVGLDVSYVSAEVDFDGSSPETIRYSFAAEPVTAKVNIYNEAGEAVYTGDVPKGAGANSFVWDGKDKAGQPVPEGTYTVSIDAFDNDENLIETQTVVNGRVRGIETQNGVIFVLVGDRAVSISSIINATVPEAAPSDTETPTTA